MFNFDELFIRIFDQNDRIVHQMTQQLYDYADAVSINYAAFGGGDPPTCLFGKSDSASSSFPPGNTDSVGFPVYPFTAGRLHGQAFRRDLAMRCRSFGGSNVRQFTVDKVPNDLLLQVGDVLESSVVQKVVSDLQVSSHHVSNSENFNHEREVEVCYSASRGSKRSKPSGGVVKSRPSSVKLDSQNSSLIDHSAINYTGPVTRSGTSFTDPDCEKRPLNDLSNYTGRITRPRASSSKFHHENGSSRDGKICQYIDHIRTSTKPNFETRLLKSKNMKKDKPNAEEAGKASYEKNQNLCCDNIFQNVDAISSGYEHAQVGSFVEVTEENAEHEGGSELPFPEISQNHSTEEGSENQHVKVLRRSSSQQKSNTIASRTQHLESKDTFSFRSSIAQRNKRTTMECLEMVSILKSDTPVQSSISAKYGIESSSIGQTVIPSDPCNPSRNDQLCTRNSTSNSSSICGIFPETRDAVVFNSNKDDPKECAWMKTTLIDAAEVDGMELEEKYFSRSSTSNNKAEASVELYRTLDSSYLRNKKDSTSQERCHIPILDSDERIYKNNSADKLMPIVECHNFKLSNEVNHEMSDTSNELHFSQRKSSVSEAVLQVEVKEEDILRGTDSTVLDLRKQRESDAAAQEFLKHSLRPEYSGNLYSAEALKSGKSHNVVDSSDCKYAALTDEIITKIDDKEETNGIADTVLDLTDHHPSTDVAYLPCQYILEDKGTGFSVCADNSVSIGLATHPYKDMEENRITTFNDSLHTSAEIERFSSALSSDHGVKEISDVPGTFHLTPEIEGFTIGSPFEKMDCNNTTDLCFSIPTLYYAKVLDTGKSTELTPLLGLSSKTKMHGVQDILPSKPGDLLEHIHTTVSPDFNREKSRQPGDYCFQIHSKAYDSAGRNNSLSEKSMSRDLSSAKFLFEYNTRFPSSTHSFDKYSHSTSLTKSSSNSGKLVNPELVCFRIDENASTTGEHEIPDEFDKIVQEMAMSSDAVVSENRKSVSDTNMDNDVATVISTAKNSLDGDSLHSVSTKFSMGLQVTEDKKVEHECRSSVRYSDKNNGKVFLSARRNNAVIESSPHKKATKSKSSLKIRDPKTSPITSTKGKPSNIVANISSFIPLVQQKKQANVIQTEKRGIKVKALEAAEAAKRKEQIKQKEREMKKEAARQERVRLEREKVKQLELELKKKEDGRKKKEAELEARKRQREEEEKKEKQRKRRCLEEKFRQQKQQTKMSDEVKIHQTESTDDIRQKITKNVVEPSEIKNVEEMELKGNNVNYEFNKSGVVDEETRKKLTMTENRGSQSYEMSPYHDSDLEDDEDKIQGMKPIPLWARKESLNEILQSQRLLNAATIFCRKRSFDLGKVLSHRIRPRPFTQL